MVEIEQVDELTVPLGVLASPRGLFAAFRERDAMHLPIELRVAMCPEVGGLLPTREAIHVR